MSSTTPIRNTPPPPPPCPLYGIRVSPILGGWKVLPPTLLSTPFPPFFFFFFFFLLIRLGYRYMYTYRFCRLPPSRSRCLRSRLDIDSGDRPWGPGNRPGDRAGAGADHGTYTGLVAGVTTIYRLKYIKSQGVYEK